MTITGNTAIGSVSGGGICLLDYAYPVSNTNDVSTKESSIEIFPNPVSGVLKF